MDFRILPLHIAVFLLEGSSCWAAGNEELVVRATYAKIELGARLDRLIPALQGLRYTPRVNDDIRIHIDDLKSGDIADILQRPYEDLVAKPSGRVLSGGGLAYTEIEPQTKLHSIALSEWYTRCYLAEDWSVPVSRVFALTNVPAYTRYASFHVRIWYHGETRQYRAMFLFRDAQSNSPDRILCADNILGSTVQNALGLPLAEDVPKLNKYAGLPAVREFQRLLQPETDCVAESRSNLCCSVTTGNCGLYAYLAQTSSRRPFSQTSMLASALLQNPQDCVSCSTYNKTTPGSSNASDNKYHTSGNHAGAAGFQGNCTYSGSSLPCNPKCTVSIVAPGTTETGTVTSACHVTNHGQGTLGGTTSCSGTVGYGVSSCLFCACSVSVSWTGAGFSFSGGTPVWDYTSPPFNNTCSTIQ